MIELSRNGIPSVKKEQMFRASDHSLVKQGGSDWTFGLKLTLQPPCRGTASFRLRSLDIYPLARPIWGIKYAVFQPRQFSKLANIGRHVGSWQNPRWYGSRVIKYRQKHSQSTFYHILSDQKLISPSGFFRWRRWLVSMQLQQNDWVVTGSMFDWMSIPALLSRPSLNLLGGITLCVCTYRLVLVETRTKSSCFPLQHRSQEDRTHGTFDLISPLCSDEETILPFIRGKLLRAVSAGAHKHPDLIQMYESTSNILFLKPLLISPGK